MSTAQHLRNVPIFSDLKDTDLNIIAEKMVSRSYEKGKMILLEESQGETFFIIKSGAVKVTCLIDVGRGGILAILGESDFFGEMSLLDGEGRSANIVSNEDAEVLTLSRSDFLDCLETYPKIAIALLEELAIRLRKSDQHIESLSLSDSEHRIAITLIRFAQELGTIKKGEVTIRNLPFQQDIANMAGTSRETVSRTIKLLEEKNLVKKDKKDLIIYNFDEFRQLFS